MSTGTLLNTAVGAYRLIDFLGAGGMGEVYRAVHVSLGRVVALKVLTAVGTDAVSLERFRNEARVHAKLQHPNIATLFDFLDSGGRPCIVMEYVDGETLDDVVRRTGGLPPRQALRAFSAVADAVGYLHANGIIHRDIKSNNVKISSTGAVKLLDFGIAKASFSPTLTATGSVIGTIHYLAPEQLRRGGADARSDVWALGILLYEMVTGRLPFGGEGPGSLAQSILRASYAPASQVRPAVPREVDRIIARCLRRDPADRYPTATALATDVNGLLTAPVPTEGYAPGPRQQQDADGPPQGPPLRERIAAAVSAVGVHLHRPGPQWRRAAAGAAAAGALVFLIWALTGPAPGPVPPPPADSADRAFGAIETAGPATPRLQTVRITVRGGSALVYREGRFLNGTPLELREAVGEHVRLTLERAGYEPLQVEFTVGPDSTAYEFDLTPLPSLVVPQDRDSAAAGLLALFPFRRLGRRRRRQAEGAGAASGASPYPGTGVVTRVEPSPPIEAASVSDAGCAREVNEDAIRVVALGPEEEGERRGCLAVVADGMGGHLAGEIASRLAVEQVVESFTADPSDLPAEALARALRRANGAVLEAARADPALAGMGTTCTALAIRGGLAWCAHVGDSRLYLARNGQLLQMTEDHSSVMDLVRRGLLTRDEARHHPERNVILRALGSENALEVSIWPRPFAVRAGDRFLLCTDGLYDLVEDDELLARVTAHAPATACRWLVALARERGAPDNVSVAVLALGARDRAGAGPAPAAKATRVSEEAVP